MKFRSGVLTGSVCLALLLASCIFCRGEIVTITTSADTMISQTYPENNFGAMPFFNSGTTQNSNFNRGLLKFDITNALPANAVIQSATLTLEVVGDPNEDFPSPQFNLFRALRPWGEGSGTNQPGSGEGLGSLATTNEATWTHRFAFTEETWAQPGARTPEDFVATASSGVTIGGVDESPYTFPSTPRVVADLQFWLEHPDLNFGWFLICEQETTRFTARRFGSHEDAFNAPQLEITYRIAPRIEHVIQTNNTIQFQFAAEPGYTYAVEYRTNVTGAPWQPLTNIELIENATGVIVTDSLNSARRFYRVTAH